MSVNHRIYVGTIGEGVFRSVDGGETFARACDGMAFVECHVRALVVHPREPNVLYLGCESGLYRSSDGADSWTRIESPANDTQVWSLLIPEHYPNIIVVGCCPSKIFTSTDAGRTWHEGTTRMRHDCPRIQYTRVTCLLADPDNPEVWWAGVEIDGLHCSRDHGRTWQRIGEGLTSQDIHALAKVPGGAFLAATNNDLNVSSDHGQTWRGLNIATMMPWAYCRTLAQLPGRPTTIFLGNGNGPPGSAGAIGRSDDGGATWRPWQLPRQANSTIWNFALFAGEPKIVYANSVSGEVYRSYDAGNTWQKLEREFGEIRALAWTNGERGA